MLDIKKLLTKILTGLLNKVDKSGDTMTGALTLVGDKDVILKGTNDHDVDPTANRYTPGFYIQDKNEHSAGYVRQFHSASGTLGLQIEAQKNVNGTRYQNCLYLTVDSNGDPYVDVTPAGRAPAAWRRAIGIATNNWTTLGCIRYTKYGNIVVVTYADTKTLTIAAKTWVTLETLPTGYRPASEVRGVCACSNNAQFGVVSVTTAGLVRVWYAAALSGAQQHQFNLTYVVPN